jgi:hypothetical protein
MINGSVQLEKRRRQETKNRKWIDDPSFPTSAFLLLFFTCDDIRPGPERPVLIRFYLLVVDFLSFLN